MRILVLAGYGPSLLGFRLPFLRHLVHSGHEVHACAPETSPELAKNLSGAGVTYHHVPLRRAALSPLADVAYARAVQSLARRLRIEGGFAYTHKPICIGLPALARAGVRTRVALITGLGYAFTQGPSGLRRRVAAFSLNVLYRRALARATHIFFQNADDADLFRMRGLLDDAPPPLIVAGSGVPLNEFPERPLPSNGMVFLMLSRLLVDKGVREYVAAAEMLRREYPESRFLLGGSLDDNPSSVKREELDEWIRRGAIEYLGNLTDVRPALESCSVFVLPSYREGTPRSVLEAMSTGRPVITTDAPGCRETMLNLSPADQHGVRRADNGFAVPVADVQALCDAMRLMMENPGLAQDMGKASLDFAESRFDARKVSKLLGEPFEF